MLLGPDLPTTLHSHQMVQVGFGQAIIGGNFEMRFSDREAGLQSKIYHVTCSQRICKIETLSQELPVPKMDFVAIPIPDEFSGCKSEGSVHTG